MRKALLLAAVFAGSAGPAAAGETLHTLYEKAAERAAAAEAAPGTGVKSGARAVYGRYGQDRLEVRPSPVVSVLRLRHLPDGRAVVECSVHQNHGLPEALRPDPRHRVK